MGLFPEISFFVYPFPSCDAAEFIGACRNSHRAAVARTNVKDQYQKPMPVNHTKANIGTAAVFNHQAAFLVSVPAVKNRSCFRVAVFPFHCDDFHLGRCHCRPGGAGRLFSGRRHILHMVV